MTLTQRLEGLRQGLRACVQRERDAEEELAEARRARLLQEGAILALTEMLREEEKASARGTTGDGKG